MIYGMITTSSGSSSSNADEFNAQWMDGSSVADDIMDFFPFLL